MQLKLALRNIRRSARDYAIYFVTLIFGVMIFYAFNSIGSQQVLFDFESEASASQFEVVTYVLGLFSGLIACVLGFLVLYANQFLIKRRKREFGTYLILGMRPLGVSAIVMFETVLVGLVSLAVGLVFGVLISQGLSYFSALLLGQVMAQYQFVFSFDACMQTILYFAIIFALTLVLNVFMVNRYKLIDLIRGDKQNERGGTRNPWVCLVAFLISIGVLAYAYEQLIENGLVMLDDPRFARATVAMLIGTFIFFWSLAGFAVNVLTHLRGVYLRGLTSFNTRQIASRINTAFMSLWVVCVLVFFSLTTFSSGMGLVDVFIGGAERGCPYDATLEAQVWYGPDGTKDSSTDVTARRSEMQEAAPERLAQAESYDWSMAAALKDAAPVLWDETVGAYAQVDTYTVTDGTTFGQLCERAGLNMGDYLDSVTAEKMPLEIVSQSQYNDVCRLGGFEEVHLNDSQFALANNLQMSDPLARELVKSGVSIDIEGSPLTIVDKLYNAQLEDDMMTSTVLCIVVPDEIIERVKDAGCIPERSYLDIDYADNGKTALENDNALAEILTAAQPIEMGGFVKGTSGAGDTWASLLWPVTGKLTAHNMENQSATLRLMITYLALYIGIVLLVCTAAVLAIQQLSQTADSLGRYRTLWCLGAERRKINRSVLVQVCIYFLAPLGLAVCHTVCAVSVLSNSLISAIGGDIIPGALAAAAFVAVVYGGYMLVTYFVSKSMVTTMLKQA